MAKRKDGLERKQQLLESATKVFADKGFRETTIADICRDARSNTASVNYYFGSKIELYAEVWKTAFHKAITKYPPDMRLGPEASARDQLRAMVQSFLHKMLDTGELGSAGQILLMELTNPTEAITHIKQDAIDPLRKRMVSIIRELLGEQAAEQDVVFCAMSVIHQCMGFGFHRFQLPVPLHDIKMAGLHAALAEHITQFSLAGIAAVKKRSAHSS
jgi:AcrR family transcriptional regulator